MRESRRRGIGPWRAAIGALAVRIGPRRVGGIGRLGMALGLLAAGPAAAEPLVLPLVLEAAASTQVFARISGVVQDVRHAVGDTVAPGDTLACLEDDELRLAEELARLAFTQATARQARAQALQALGGLAAQEVEALDFAAQSAALRLQQAVGTREGAVLRAPQAGIVAEVHLTVGQRLTAGQLSFRLFDPTDLQGELYLPLEQLAQVRLGQPVAVPWPQAPDQHLTGTVVQRSPWVEPASGRGRVRLHFPQAGRWAPPGAWVDVILSPLPEEHAR